jgi:prepilin-type processing-associated H-X9-DG protein
MRYVASRRALTIVELIVVMALVAILTGLLVVAVVKARGSADAARSRNNLKQIVLATHHFAAGHHGSLPKLGPGNVTRDATGVITGLGGEASGPSLFVQLLPLIDGQTPQSKKGKHAIVPVYMSPADPTVGSALANLAAVTSYAANAEVFLDQAHMESTFADGTSSTIMFGEHYSFGCNRHSFPYWLVVGRHNSTYGGIPHRPSFADLGDVTPVTYGPPPTSGPSEVENSVSTFQVAPSVSQCRPEWLQTPHSSGMIVAMADGSVRQLSGNISPPVFWGAVTPSRGEVIELPD